MGQKIVKILGHALPIFLSFIRDTDKNILNRIRRLFREAIILFFALYFMLDCHLTDYLTLFTLLLMAVYSLYEIGYI